MSARRLVTPLITGARRWMSTNPGASASSGAVMSSNPGTSSSSGAPNMSGSFPSSMAPDAKPETYDTKDQIDKMVQDEIRIAEAERQHHDAVWCGSSQDEPHMRDNLKALFLASVKHENQEPGNTFRITEPWWMKRPTVNVIVQKKPIPRGVCVQSYCHLKNEEFYSMETNTHTKEDGTSVISVKTITQNRWSTNEQNIDKDYRDTWRKKLKESE